MSNEITSTSEMAEAEFDGSHKPEDVRSDLVATRTAESKGIEFHVSMRDYTLQDMEGLIIEAAARILVGRHNERDLAKSIEARAIEQITARADKALASVTAEIIDQPMTPSFGEKKPVTMREFLGLYGREYLTERVGSDGKPGTDRWGRDRTRMEWLVGQHMNAVFAEEIKKATSAAINEITAAIRAKHKEVLEAEKARFREYIEKAVAP